MRLIPACKCRHIIKFGIKKGKQRYACKDCKKVFLETTSTILYKSKYSLKTWPDYVTCMLSGHTCRYTDKAIGINYKLKAGKEYKRGIYHLGHIYAFHASIKKFMLTFNGVSTKLLPNYLNWRIWMNRTVDMIQSNRSIDDTIFTMIS